MNIPWLTALLSRGSRALVVAIAMLPVLLLVILSAPAWIVWPLLSAERRESVHLMVQQLASWTRDILSETTPPSAAEASEQRNVVGNPHRLKPRLNARV
jgi:hypothetical protein